jgi:hypothetical protein
LIVLAIFSRGPKRCYDLLEINFSLEKVFRNRQKSAPRESGNFLELLDQSSIGENYRVTDDSTSTERQNIVY